VLTRLRDLMSFVVAGFSATAFASAPAVSVQHMPQAQDGAPMGMQCFVAAGERYRVDPLLLYAIAEVESNLDPKAVNRNRDGSTDYGLMQVNSQHLPRLKNLGIDANRLLNEPCLSIHTGASILAGMIFRHGYTWMAVGAYNAGGGSGRSEARNRYAQKVWRRYSSLKSGRGNSQAGSTPIKTSRPQPVVGGYRWSADDDMLVPVGTSTHGSSITRRRQ